MQVLHESGDGLIKVGQVFLGILEVLPMPVPEAVAERHHTHTGLDETAGQQELLIEARRGIALNLFGAFAVALADFGRLFGEVEGIDELRGSQDAVGLLAEDIDARHSARGIGLAAEGIESREQPAAVAQTLQGDTIERHVLLAALQRHEGRMRHAEEARTALVVRSVLHLLGKIHIAGHGGGSAFELGHHAADLRPASGRRVVAEASGHALKALMPILGTDDAADEAELVGHFGHARQVLADLDAGDLGADGFERAAHFGRGVQLDVIHVLVWWAAGQVNQDEGLLRFAHSLGRLRTQ